MLESKDVEADEKIDDASSGEKSQILNRRKSENYSLSNTAPSAFSRVTRANSDVNEMDDDFIL